MAFGVDSGGGGDLTLPPTHPGHPSSCAAEPGSTPSFAARGRCEISVGARRTERSGGLVGLGWGSGVEKGKRSRDTETRAGPGRGRGACRLHGNTARSPPGAARVSPASPPTRGAPPQPPATGREREGAGQTARRLAPRPPVARGMQMRSFAYANMLMPRPRSGWQVARVAGKVQGKDAEGDPSRSWGRPGRSSPGVMAGEGQAEGPGTDGGGCPVQSRDPLLPLLSAGLSARPKVGIA